MNPLTDRQVFSRIDAMRLQARQRDARQRDLVAIRRNNYQEIAGDLMTEDFDRPMVANLIDTAARDIAEVMAPLPSITCASSSLTSETKKKFANKRSLIANSYVQNSRLEEQMYLGADRYASFGYLVYIVEPDFEDQQPAIRVSDSLSSYWTLDYRGRVVQFVDIKEVPAHELCYMFPDDEGLAALLRKQASTTGHEYVEVGWWYDKHEQMIVLPQHNIILKRAPNPLGRPPVRIVMRPNIEGNSTVKGQFDDVIGVQVARAIIAQYTLQAVDKSVNAPMVVPQDVQDLQIGPEAVIQTDQPNSVGRVRLDVPPGLFPEMQVLAQEQREGSRYPEGRSGSIDASIITGQGVQALMGTFDTQIQSFQKLNETALEDVISMCFEMDELLWPNVERSVRVRDAGSPVELTYTPSRDIRGDYSVEASYGAVAGLDPNRSLIFLLQAVAGGFMSRETARRYLPVELDHVAENRLMVEEQLRDALLAAVASLSQAIPMFATQGGDPRQIVEQQAALFDRIEKGDSIEEAVRKVFAPKEDAQQQEAGQDDLASLMAALGGGGAGGGGGPAGLPMQEPSVGQDLLMGLAGITPSGNPNLQSTVSTRQLI